MNRLVFKNVLYLKLKQKIIYHKCMVGISASYSTEVKEACKYPPIEDTSFLTLKRNKLKTWKEKIEKLPTVEQKLVELNMPKYYGHYSILLEDDNINPFAIDFIKFLTRTKVIDYLPLAYYDDQEEQAIDEAVNNIRDHVKNLIVYHSKEPYRVKYKVRGFEMQHPTEGLMTNENFLIDLNNVMMKSLKGNLDYLSINSIDIRPRIEGFWFVGGFEPPYGVKNIRRKHVKFHPENEKYVGEPMDRSVRSSINTTVAVRSIRSLPPVVDLEASLDSALAAKLPEKAAVAELARMIAEGKREQKALEEAMVLDEGAADMIERPDNSSEEAKSEEEWVNPYKAIPESQGVCCRRRRATIIPGFWPGTKAENGQLFMTERKTLEHTYKLSFKGVSSVDGSEAEECKTVLRSQSDIYNAFTRAMSYAFYQGFTPVNELLYPVVQQHLTSDGRLFQFSVYQLNTVNLSADRSINNERTNFLWRSKDMPLYDRVEDGRVIGLNEEVLRLLCRFYLKKGLEQQQPTPYLADYKYVMNHEAASPEFRQKFLEQMRYLTSERRRHKSMPTIALWERIYKIYFNDRFFEKRNKFFNNKWVQNPYYRRLDDHKPVHIPRVRRKNDRISAMPRLNSELLFKYDIKTLIRDKEMLEDNPLPHRSFNVRWDTAPYFNGTLWSRLLNNRPYTL